MSSRNPPPEIGRPLKAWHVARNRSVELLSTANSDDDRTARAVSESLMQRLAAAEMALLAMLELHVDEHGNWVSQ